VVWSPGSPAPSSGIPVFGGRFDPTSLSVTGTRTFDSGAALVTYTNPARIRAASAA